MAILRHDVDADVDDDDGDDNDNDTEDDGDAADGHLNHESTFWAGIAETNSLYMLVRSPTLLFGGHHRDSP